MARLSFPIGVGGVALLLAGPLAALAGLLTPLWGFRLFLLGGLLGLAALLVAAVHLFRTRPASGRDGRGGAWSGGAIGLAILLALAAAGAPGLWLPPINDITTDPSDPPVFVAALDVEANRGRDMRYPGEVFATRQRAAYPDLAPIELPHPPDQALFHTVSAINQLGWHVTRLDIGAREAEATDTSRIFRFVDDVVVRARPSESGSIVDARSKSRDGTGDLGANATRIRALRETLLGPG
jgi:uncharacterized protein (DUF1499 family)